MKEFKRIIKKLGYKRTILLTSLIILYSVTALIPVFFIQKTIDALDIEDFQKSLIQIAIFGSLYLFFQVLSQFLYALFNYLGDKFQNRYAADLRIRTFNKVYLADELKLKKIDFSKITNSIIQDSQTISEEYFSIFLTGIASVINFILGVTMVAFINIYMPLVIIPLGIITALCSKKISDKSKVNLDEQKKITEETWKVYSEGITGVKNIKFFKYPKAYIDKVSFLSNRLSFINVKQSKNERFGSCLVGTLYMVSIGIIMIVSSILVLNKFMSIGALVALLMYNNMLIDPLLNMIETKQKLMKVNVSMNRIEKIVAVEEYKKEQEYFPIDQIVFDNVSFSYDSKNIFSNFNYKFERNSKYLIVGETGKGKSTIFNLISGYISPLSGKIIYKSNNDEKTNIIPNNISYLIQNGFIFNSSISDNIKLVNPDLKDEEITSLIHDCLLDEVASRTNNSLGDNGSLLSGGERKRLLLACTLARKDSDVFLFDEISSSLDKDSYLLIMNNIQKYFKNKIVIFIEHNVYDSSLYDQVIQL